jgi:2-keto-3-deoxy-L-fuconate dehydrogenase
MIEEIKDMIDEAFKSSTADIVPLNRVGKPQEVASLIAFLLSDDVAFITGTVQVIDGGVAA